MTILSGREVNSFQGVLLGTSHRAEDSDIFRRGPRFVSPRFELGVLGLLLGLLLAIVGATWFNAAARADCRTDPARLAFGVDTDASAVVRAGMACTIAVRAGTFAVDEFRITSDPKNGVLMPRGRTGVVYRPHPGFKGEDVFAFNLRGKSASYAGTSIVRVRVTVN